MCAVPRLELLYHGATGTFVAGGAFATARAGGSSTAIVKARLHPQTIARSLSACAHAERITTGLEPEFI